MRRLKSIWERHFSKFVLVSYWFFGLCNNFAYVIMLSAAHDILSPNNNSSTTPVSNQTNNHTNKYDCNDASTGTILLADILPGLVIKLIAPFFVHKIKYNYRVCIVILINAASYLIVSLAPAEYRWLIFIGVMCASFSSSFGEITFLSMSTMYSKSLSLTGWGSGTGAAGLVGSFGYAALTSLNISPRTTILIMLFNPVLMLVSYICLPSIAFTKEKFSKFEEANENDVKNSETEVSVQVDVDNDVLLVKSIHPKLNNKFKNILVKFRPLIKYMIPLFFVYFAEYFINQGLFELLYFKDSSLISDHKLQYRWYNVTYQLAVFISRSSIRWIQIKYLSIFPVFQMLNVGIVLSQIFFGYFPSIWIALLIIFWEGLLGGGCYVNAFNQVLTDLPKKDQEWSIAVVSISDSIGISLAGFLAIPVHNAICNYGNK